MYWGILCYHVNISKGFLEISYMYLHVFIIADLLCRVGSEMTHIHLILVHLLLSLHPSLHPLNLQDQNRHNQH